MNKICRYLAAKYRSFAPLSCFLSPRPDTVVGLERWQWLVKMRRSGRLVDPSVEVRCVGGLMNKLVLGMGTALDKGTILWVGDECGEPGSITFGDNVYIGPYCYLGSCHKLVIGSNSLIGAHSYLITVNHRTDRAGLPVNSQGYKGGSIYIGNNVWLGAGVVILPNVSIGDDAVIGAGSVVTKSIPSGETWAGVPAKKLK